MNSDLRLYDLRLYWALFLRRLPVMALFIVVGSALGIVTATRLPDIYETTARLLVEAPQIPDRMVTSTVQTEATEQLDIIEQKLLTRANMIDIAQRFAVFENIRDMEPDEVVEAMRKATEVRRSAGKDQATLMTISFEASRPRTVADVVNAYVTLVLEENAKFRVSRAENTLSFFEQEVERLGQELNAQSAAISEFKSEHADALPEDQPYRLGRQTLLQERLSGLERDLRAGEEQRAEIIRIFESTGRVQPGTGGVRQTQAEQDLVVAQAELGHVKETYSEDSPRVIRLQARIERLEAVIAAQNAAAVSADNEETSPERALLDATLIQIDSRLESLRDEIEDVGGELEKLQDRISQSAVNGIQLTELERDYAIIQSRYNAAVQNLSEAQMSERIETTAQGQRITVIENANVPQVPSGPNRPKTAAMGVAGGIGLAGAYFALLELLNRTIRSPAELTGRFNITPITTIPYMTSRLSRSVQRIALLGTAAAVVIGVSVGLWYIDTHYMPLQLIVQKGLDAFGLG